MAKNKNEKNESTSTFISNLVEQYRNEKISISQGKVECDFIDTGNDALNYIMSGNFNAGLPVGGQIIEIYGDSESGKSVLCYTLAANFLKQYPDAVVVLDDTEEAYVDYLGSSIELDEKRLIRLSSATVECHANMVFMGGPVLIHDEEEGNIKISTKRNMQGEEETVRRYKDTKIDTPLVQKLYEGGVKNIMVILDSVAVLSTKHEFTIGVEKPDMGKAKLLRALLRLVKEPIKNYKVTYVITNHMTFKINQGMGMFMGGPEKVPTGGTGIGYSSGIRLQTLPAGKVVLKDTKLILGLKSNVTVSKNRFAAPYRTTELRIMFDKGISRHSGIIVLLKNLGLLGDAVGGWYTIKGTNIKFQESQLPEKWESIKEEVLKSNILTRKLEEDVANVQPE